MQMNTATKVAKSTGRVLGVASGVITVYDAVSSSQVNASHLLDASITAISFVAFVGPIIGGSYFVGGLIHRAYYGYSIGDRLDSRIGEPLLDWD